MSKFPEDLRVYEHLLWLSGADVVVELGVQHGGSSLWFRDRLRSLTSYRGGSAPRVIGVDVDSAAAVEAISRADPDWRETITILEADVRDPALPARVAGLVPDGARCLVVEDTAHEYDTTRAALEGFSSFVPPGGYFVVEDGCVDVEELRVSPDWPRGVLPALMDWLATDAGSAFEVRRDLELGSVRCSV